MWVADMDFRTAPEVRKAIEKRLEHGVFGYADVPDDWYDAYIKWRRTRHGFEMGRDWLIFCTGVVPAISSTVRKLTTPNENVVIQTPVYNIFFSSIVNNGCRVLESPLCYKNGAYSMNFEDLEEKLSDPQTTLMILCNPHNPVLRHKVWRALNTDEVAEPNSFAATAAIAAFEKGGDWLDALLSYIAKNKEQAADFISNEIPGVFVVESDATYLLWIDVSCLWVDSAEIAEFIRKSTGLYLSAGTSYGQPGKHFLRMNVACSREVCLDGLSRLKNAIKQYRNERE